MDPVHPGAGSVAWNGGLVRLDFVCGTSGLLKSGHMLQGSVRRASHQDLTDDPGGCCTNH